MIMQKLLAIIGDLLCLVGLNDPLLKKRHMFECIIVCGKGFCFCTVKVVDHNPDPIGYNNRLWQHLRDFLKIDL